MTLLAEVLLLFHYPILLSFPDKLKNSLVLKSQSSTPNLRKRQSGLVRWPSWEAEAWVPVSAQLLGYYAKPLSPPDLNYPHLFHDK